LNFDCGGKAGRHCEIVSGLAGDIGERLWSYDRFFAIPNRCWMTVASLVVLLFVMFGCGPSGFQKHLYQLRVDTKKQHKVADVQAALVPFFSDQRMLTNQLPKEITSLPIFADDPTNIEVCTTESTNVLLFYIGGGFGHWGLIVARPGHDREISSWHRDRATPWEDGEYFYSEYK
jgi:hypothetical protein